MPTHQQSFPRKRESNFTKTYNHGNLHEQLLLAGEVARADMPADQVSLREIAKRTGGLSCRSQTSSWAPSNSKHAK